MTLEIFPENFLRLYGGEESLRLKNIEEIINDEALLLHAHAIECAMDTIKYFTQASSKEDNNQLVIQWLGCRIFNASASALKLLLSGYYQASALQQRDLLEMAFLLDYFSIDKNFITEWTKKETEKEFRNKFRPVNVREALRKRDNFTECKRTERYDFLCKLAGHPTYEGFRMLTIVPGGDARIGPFDDTKAMAATLVELARTMIEASEHFQHFFEHRNDTDIKQKFLSYENKVKWFERFYSRPLDREFLEEMCAALIGENV